MSVAYKDKVLYRLVITKYKQVPSSGLGAWTAGPLQPFPSETNY